MTPEEQRQNAIINGQRIEIESLKRSIYALEQEIKSLKTVDDPPQAIDFLGPDEKIELAVQILGLEAVPKESFVYRMASRLVAEHLGYLDEDKPKLDEEIVESIIETNTNLTAQVRELQMRCNSQEILIEQLKQEAGLTKKE